MNLDRFPAPHNHEVGACLLHAATVFTTAYLNIDAGDDIVVNAVHYSVKTHVFVKIQKHCCINAF